MSRSELLRVSPIFKDALEKLKEDVEKRYGKFMTTPEATEILAKRMKRMRPKALLLLLMMINLFIISL